MELGEGMGGGGGKQARIKASGNRTGVLSEWVGDGNTCSIKNNRGPQSGLMSTPPFVYSQIKRRAATKVQDLFFLGKDLMRHTEKIRLLREAETKLRFQSHILNITKL